MLRGNIPVGYRSTTRPDNFTRWWFDRIPFHFGAKGVAGNAKHTRGPRLVALGTFQNFLDQWWLNFGQQHLVQVFRGRVSHVLKISAYRVFYMFSEGNGVC